MPAAHTVPRRVQVGSYRKRKSQMPWSRRAGLLETGNPECSILAQAKYVWVWQIIRSPDPLAAVGRCMGWGRVSLFKKSELLFSPAKEEASGEGNHSLWVDHR